MKLLMCHCQACKHGRKFRYDTVVKNKRHRARSKVRSMLRHGKYEDLPQAVVVGYTD